MSACSPGYTGTLCGMCDTHFFRDGHDCTPCKASSLRVGYWELLFVLLAVLLLAGVGLKVHNRRRDRGTFVPESVLRRIEEGGSVFGAEGSGLTVESCSNPLMEIASTGLEEQLHNPIPELPQDAVSFESPPTPTCCRCVNPKCLHNFRLFSRLSWTSTRILVALFQVIARGICFFVELNTRSF